jgi:hypothetical protein
MPRSPKAEVRRWYQYYFADGDGGNAVTEQMAWQASPELLGTHTNMPATVPDDVAKVRQPGDSRPSGLSADERHACDQVDYFYRHGVGYAIEMANRLQMLCGIVNSPAGPAAWDSRSRRADPRIHRSRLRRATGAPDARRRDRQHRVAGGVGKETAWPAGLQALPDMLVRLSRVAVVSIASTRGRNRSWKRARTRKRHALRKSREADSVPCGEVGAGLVPGGGPMAPVAAPDGQGPSAASLPQRRRYPRRFCPNDTVTSIGRFRTPSAMASLMRWRPHRVIDGARLAGGKI